jgi:hypothetical protein
MQIHGSDQNVNNRPSAAPHRLRGRLFLLLGVGVAILGVVACVVQFSLERLRTPWYMAALAALGVVLVGISAVERRSFWRVFALVALELLLFAELGLFYALRLPPYTGPILVGRPFPAFETKQADGKPFTHQSLASERHNVLVFFRGRW